MSEKTEETREILDVSTILTTFLRHGIYRFKFEDVTEAMPFGILSALKRETFGRWLRNPFYQYIPELQAWQFLYGKKITFFNKNKKDIFGLEDAICDMGHDNFVRWLRIWSSNFAEGSKSDPEATLALENKIVTIYQQGCKLAAESGLYTANKMARKELHAVWEQACNLKGRPDYLKMPVQIGRKFNVIITRNAQKRNEKTFTVVARPSSDGYTPLTDFVVYSEGDV